MTTRKDDELKESRSLDSKKFKKIQKEEEKEELKKAKKAQKEEEKGKKIEITGDNILDKTIEN